MCVYILLLFYIVSAFLCEMNVIIIHDDDDDTRTLRQTHGSVISPLPPGFQTCSSLVLGLTDVRAN